MDLHADWPTIRRTFEAGIASSKHCALASVDERGHPHVTPIGFVFLREAPSAFYFEQYSERLPENLKHQRQVCLLSVQSGFGFWLRSLARARFPTYPGVRLYGEAGALRPATADELAQLQARIGKASLLPGSKLIWSGLCTVRDIQLHSAAAVRYPKMMEHL